MLQRVLVVLALAWLAQGCAYDADQYEPPARDLGGEEEEQRDVGKGDSLSDVVVDIDDFSEDAPADADLGPADAPGDVDGEDAPPPVDQGDDAAADLAAPDVVEDVVVDQGDDLAPADVGPDLVADVVEDATGDVVEDVVEDVIPVDVGPDLPDDVVEDVAQDVAEDVPPVDMGPDVVEDVAEDVPPVDMAEEVPPEPTPELDNRACSDGLDNDQDGFVDCLDFDCSRNVSVTICPREDNDETCSDGVDNDGDGFIDCRDFDCSRNGAVRVCQAEEGDAACRDGVDNDQDGAIDCDDLDCAAAMACAPPAQVEDSDALCRDGRDNDNDGFIDCQDYDCSRNPEVTVCPAEATDALCQDNVDNDGDGFTDCDDHSCSQSDAVTVCDVSDREDTLARCQDGMDNDSDGVFDCEEVSCQQLYTASLCGPDPYRQLLGLSGASLRASLLAVLEGHTVRSYNNAREFMYGIQDVVDVEGGDIECVYTGLRVQPDGTRTPGGFNTEHSWPRSLGADQSPAVSDIFHLFPATASSNQARSNFPFGETPCLSQRSCMWEQGGSALGLDSNGRVVFQVRAARRGDIARALFYFSVRYGLPLDALQEVVLRRWHEADPPDAWERARNRRVEDVQSRLNPFVLHPELVAEIDDF